MHYHQFIYYSSANTRMDILVNDVLLPSFTSESVINNDDIFCTEQKWDKTLDVTNQISMLFIYVNTVANTLITVSVTAYL